MPHKQQIMVHLQTSKKYKGTNKCLHTFLNLKNSLKSIFLNFFWMIMQIFVSKLIIFNKIFFLIFELRTSKKRRQTVQVLLGSQNYFYRVKQEIGNVNGGMTVPMRKILLLTFAKIHSKSNFPKLEIPNPKIDFF